MKKFMMMMAAIALMVGMSQAAAVLWSSGAIKDPVTGLNIGSTTGAYLAQVFFYTDAAGTVPLEAGTGTQVQDTSSSLSAFGGTTASVFPASTPAGNYWAQMIITSADGNWIMTSALVGLVAIPPSGSLGVNFTLGTGIVGGGNAFPTTDNYGWEPIPEPTSMALLAIGVAAIGLRRRFRK